MTIESNLTTFFNIALLLAAVLVWVHMRFSFYKMDAVCLSCRTEYYPELDGGSTHHVVFQWTEEDGVHEAEGPSFFKKKSGSSCKIFVKKKDKRRVFGRTYVYAILCMMVMISLFNIHRHAIVWGLVP